uniref:Uncharacterized protein n=1 Tax=Arundo donax TaxID=35708 RepID=A0A0A8ZFI5_ARUDO
MPLGTPTPKKCVTVGRALAYRNLSFLSFATPFGKDSIPVPNASSTSKFCNLPTASGRISSPVYLRPRKRRLNKLKTSSGNVLIWVPCRSKADRKFEDAMIGLSKSISTSLVKV